MVACGNIGGHFGQSVREIACYGTVGIVACQQVANEAAQSGIGHCD